MPKKHQSLSGKRFGSLLASKEIGIDRFGKHIYECVCDCGNIVHVKAERLTRGEKTSCGCKTIRKPTKLNGESRTRLYRIWLGMKFRCAKGDKYRDPHYVKNNIKVCDEWENDYWAFKDWAINHGYSDDLTIDRIDNYGNYCPENCRWVTIAQQNRNRTNNRMVEYNGTTKTLAEWARELNLNYHTLVYRFKKLGMTPAEAFTLPIQDKRENLVYYKKHVKEHDVT